MNRHRRAGVATGVLFATLIAACANDDGSSPPTSDGTVQEQSPGEGGARQTVVLESWRVDDAALWEDALIPAFAASHPDIDLIYAPSEPIAFDAEVEARLELGLPVDIVACRPFDRSLAMFEQGLLGDVSEVVDLSDYSASAKAAWTDGDGRTFCIPSASVLHGFAYNVSIMDQLGLAPPTTEAEFFDVLDAVVGRYIGLAIGGEEGWEVSEVGLLNFGPAYWGGEIGRTALLSGHADTVSSGLVDALEALSRWMPHLPGEFEGLSGAESRELFTSGGALIYPLGSWELGFLDRAAPFEVGVFPPYVLDASDACHVTEEFDIGYGVASTALDDPAVRTVLQWLTSEEFAALYAEVLPGFFSLRPDPPTPPLPAAREMQAWRDACNRTIRLPTQFASGGETSLREVLWQTAQAVATGATSVADAVEIIDATLESVARPEPVQPIFQVP